MKSELKKSVVLVHGAFADATGWQKVTRLLEKEAIAPLEASPGSRAGGDRGSIAP